MGLILVVGLAATAMLGSVTKARASYWSWAGYSYEVGEGIPLDQFSGGVAATGRNDGLGLAHTNESNGWLWASQGWAAQRVSLSPPASAESCKASVWLLPVDGGAQVGFEVWSYRPSTNEWIKVDAHYPWLDSWVVDGPHYQPVSLALNDLSSFENDAWGNKHIYLQAIYGSNNGVGKFVRVDDFTLRCWVP